MHPALLDSDEIDYNLYPALVQVFAIIFIGYLAGSFELITKPQALGLNKFVSKFALPALLFKSIVVLDFSSVNWLFLTSIFFSKAIVFISAITIAVITIRPINIGQAAIFAIYVSQSNDFALGAPIINAVYGKTHPDYLHYIYLLAPISLCILNPFGFLMMEANEIITENKKQQQHKTNAFIDDKNSDSGLPNEAFEEADISENNNTNLDAISSVDTTQKTSAESDASSLDFSNLVDPVQVKRDFRSNASTLKCSVSKSQLIKSTIWSTISNPIVFMTIIGIVANFVLKQKIPSLIEPILSSLADSFSAIALFFLGYTMIGKIKNLTFSTVIIILVLVFAKSLVFPLITREIVLHIHNFYNQTSANETESLSTFSFLYGTFPAAPSVSTCF
jgi:predicted permease